MTTHSPAQTIGYSVLRIGAGSALEACIVAPHIAQPTGIEFDAVRRRLEIKFGEVSMTLPDIPHDVVELIGLAPDRVILVTTDSMSAIRFSGSVDVFSLPSQRGQA